MPLRDDDIRAAAAMWFARMRGPDARRHRAAFEAWRDADPRNAETYRRLESHWQRSDVLRDSASLERFRAAAPWWERLATGHPTIYVPALAALILITVFGLRLGADRRSVAGPVRALASRVGEVRTLPLSDGSSVILDTDSAITAMFTAHERLVRLDRGRARFVVAHDRSRPFVVIAGSARITDIGTMFDVRLQAEQVKIVLLRGAIQVRSLVPAIASTHTGSTRLAAGQQATVPTNHAPIVSAISAGTQTAWTGGMLDFDGAPLAQMVDEINRYNVRSIVLGDQRLAGLRVTGTFRADQAAAVAHNLAALFALRIQTDAHGNWILLPRSVDAVGRPIDPQATPQAAG